MMRDEYDFLQEYMEKEVEDDREGDGQNEQVRLEVETSWKERSGEKV